MQLRQQAWLALCGMFLLCICLAKSQSISPPVSSAPASSPGAKNAINGIDSYPGPQFVKYADERYPKDRRIDYFLSDWQGSMPRAEHGSLVLRDILTRGDNFAPPERGAVLQFANFFSYARLASGASTIPAALDGQQEIFYVLSGEGEITAGGDTAKLRSNMAVLMPAGLKFAMKSTGATALTMYVINEPVPAHFQPKLRMAVKDEAAARQRTPAGGDPYIVGGASGHWAHVVRELFSPADGLATEQSVITVTINPDTLGEPHPHQPGQEEIWAAIEGTSLAMLGTETRLQKPGMAYMLPPDGVTIHSNICIGDRPAKFLYFARFPDRTDYTHSHDAKPK